MDSLTRVHILQQGLVARGLLEGSVTSVDSVLGIYGLLEGNVIVPKLKLDVHHLNGIRWLLVW